ncbi:hypothetical protein HPB52_022816 [Rhipicephalus sanguineus]|uniref:Uncharacterized protein n=2 Tax=Rhipicephalus sanguineus TaxID=34632 RepID=A0A9D4T6V6_RHISA|nr:hypothetical protein HPB52_022816 [Rhipicephalus sanguineus]
MLNMDTMQIGSAVGTAAEPPPAVEAAVETAPVDVEPPSNLERSPVVQAEPSAKVSVQKKSTLRSFFWGTSSVGKESRSKRKKELLQQLADLQRENARLQSECDHVRLIYSELKQERLIEQEKVSRAKALDRRLHSETQFMSSASQTDSCNNLLGEFRAVPRKNYAFIYNVFTVPTPEQLKRSLEKFQKSGPKVGFKNASKSDVENDDVQKDAWEDVVKAQVHADDDEVAEGTPQVIVEEATEELLTDVDEPKADARIESPVDKETGDVVIRTEAVDAKSSDSANVHDPNVQDKSSLRPSCQKIEKSDNSVVAEGETAGLVLPAQTQNVAEDPTVELKEPEVTAEAALEVQPRSSCTSVKTDATEDANVPHSEGFREEESPAPYDKDTAALDGASFLSRSSSGSKASVREGLSDAGSPCEAVPVVIASPLEDKISEKSSEKSSESSLLLRLRQAVSNMAASLETDADTPPPFFKKHDTAKSSREAPACAEVKVELVPGVEQRYGTGTEPVTSRYFLPPSHTGGGVQRDPGRREFEKRRRVSCGALRPPLQKAIVMNATVQCQHMEGAGSPPESGASSRLVGASTPSSATATPRPWSLNRVRLPLAESPHSASTPVRQLPRSPQQIASSAVQWKKAALSTPLGNDSLSSDSGTDSDCAADESSSEFHGSGRNVANTAFENRMSGVSRGTASQASSARSAAMTASTAATTVTRKKSLRKKRNSQRRASSTLPSLPSSSSSEESQRTPTRRRRPGSSRTRTATRSTTFSGASSTTPSRATGATTRPPSTACPLSPVSVTFSNNAATTDSDASRPTTAFGPKDRASTRTTVRPDSRATSTTVGGGSPSPTSRRRDLSRVTTQSSLLSRPQRDLTSSEMSPSESESFTPTMRRQFLANNASDPNSVKCKRSIFETLSSAGYTHIDDHACSRGGNREDLPTGTTRWPRQNATAQEGRPGGNRATTPTLPDHNREKGAKGAFIVQRADLYAPFPPKIMRTLLPSFIDVDPTVRPDKVPRHIPFDPGRHGDEKSNTSLFKDHCHLTPYKQTPASPPKYPERPHWEGAQSCLLPDLYSFNDESRVGDQADRKMTRFDLGEVI